MLVVENTVLSDEIFEECFVCNLSFCKGVCCVEGDAGAPLEEEEITIIEDIIDIVKPYMSRQGIKSIEKTGVFDYDSFGYLVTPLINNEECAYVYYDKGIAKCAIEKAYLDKKIEFQKPISCHLYPIRISKHAHYDALNYHRWSVCQNACNKKNNKPSIFEFVKEALIRKYGEKWYHKVQKEAALYFSNKQNLTF